MDTLNSYLRSVKKQFTELGYPAADAEDLFMHVFNIDYSQLLTSEVELPIEQKALVDDLIARRLSDEPVAHIIGYKNFLGNDFKVSKDTLIPRPETEILVNSVLDQVRFPKDNVIRVLDLGTGTGCILISILLMLKSKGYKVHGVGVDLLKGAVEIARANATNLGLSEDEFQIVCSDWNRLNFNCQFDIIVSNPPYIPSADVEDLEPSVVLHEPHLALDGGEDGLDCYKQIINMIDKISAAHAVIGFECGSGQARAIEKMLSNLIKTLVVNDLLGIERVIIGKK